MSSHVHLELVMDGSLSFPDIPQDSTVPLQSPERFQNDLVYISLHVVCVKYSEKSNIEFIVPYWSSWAVNSDREDMQCREDMVVAGKTWPWLGRHGRGWEDMAEGAGGHWSHCTHTQKTE